MSDWKSEMVKLTTTGRGQTERWFYEQWITPSLSTDQPLLHHLLARHQAKLDEMEGGPVAVDMVIFGNRRWTVEDGTVTAVEIVDLAYG